MLEELRERPKRSRNNPGPRDHSADGIVFFFGGKGMDSHRITKSSHIRQSPTASDVVGVAPSQPRPARRSNKERGRRLGQLCKPACTSTSSTKPTGHQHSKLVVHGGLSLWRGAARSAPSPATTVLQLLPRGRPSAFCPVCPRARSSGAPSSDGPLPRQLSSMKQRQAVNQYLNAAFIELVGQRDVHVLDPGVRRHPLPLLHDTHELQPTPLRTRDFPRPLPQHMHWWWPLKSSGRPHQQTRLEEGRGSHRRRGTPAHQTWCVGQLGSM